MLGINVHGLFESPEAVKAVIGAAPERSIDQAIDALTDQVTAALDLPHIEALVGVRG